MELNQQHYLESEAQRKYHPIYHCGWYKTVQTQRHCQ